MPQPNRIIAQKNYFVLYFERSHPQNVKNMKDNICGQLNRAKEVFKIIFIVRFSIWKSKNSQDVVSQKPSRSHSVRSLKNAEFPGIFNPKR